MRYDGTVRISESSVSWQDYRASNTAMVVPYDTDPVSEMAIREVPDELPSEVMPDPNYESKTYGLFGCTRNKFRSSFARSKLRYLFFMARYQGAREEFRDKYLITGVYRIVKTADVHKVHLRYLTTAACMDADDCTALLADEVHFVSLEDALPVNEDTLKLWNHTSRITRQTRLLLNENHTRNLLEYLLAKPNIVAKYIEETKRLQPHETEAEVNADEELDAADEGRTGGAPVEVLHDTAPEEIAPAVASEEPLADREIAEEHGSSGQSAENSADLSAASEDATGASEPPAPAAGEPEHANSEQQ